MSVLSPAPTIHISLFTHLQHHFSDRLQLLHCTKATLVHVSHTLEDLVLQRKLPAILFTGFQESSHWREETERYRALAEVAQQVCIFAGGQLPPEASEKEIHITLHGDDPLRQEWFLCILSPQFSVVLCGQDQHNAAEQEATRQFATLWTLDPAVIDDVLDTCEDVVAYYRPDRAAALRTARRQFPPSAPDPALMTALTMEMIRFEESLHQSLRNTTSILEQQLRWQEDMINLLVHDLRTPLQAILLSLQMSAACLDAEAQPSEMIQLAEKSARRANELVQMMLDTTKLEHGQFPINLQRIEIDRLFERVTEQLQSLIEYHSLHLHLSIAPGMQLFWGDAVLLERVLINLIGNAIKYTPANGSITLGAAVHPDGRHIELRVRDTGQGIPQEAQARIFDRLAQASTEDRRTGSGLGLYFCRLAAEAHGGSIRVNSQLGSGSTFTVTLPIHPTIAI